MIGSRAGFKDNTIGTHIVKNWGGAVLFCVFTCLALGALLNTFVATAEQYSTCYSAI